ncbi:hypothetical protein VB716_09680 [Synechococcus sp. CCY9201]|uniref:Ycf66 family protein n=1 Tax=unclassified Synechococcus TaxID=2626047 RepID=UPI002AD5AF05|nr:MULTISPECIES: Ycf66 family protein [unclassified Synechococcus]MEA5474489.1 hypothetical protein [Synechococcus sp. CCY9201]
MLATLGGSLALLLGLAVLLLPLLAQELSRPRDAVWGAVVLLLGLVLVTSADRLVGAPMVAVLCGGLLIGRLGSEVGQARWRQLTPEEQQRLWSLERWRTSLQQLLVAVGKLIELVMGLATGLASWIQERRQPRSVTKRWVRQEPAATDSSRDSSDQEASADMDSNPGAERNPGADGLQGQEPAPQHSPETDGATEHQPALETSPESDGSIPPLTAPRHEAETQPAGTAAAPSPAPEDDLTPSDLTREPSEPQLSASVQDQASNQEATASEEVEAGPEADEAKTEAEVQAEVGSAPVVRSFEDVDALLRSTPEAP